MRKLNSTLSYIAIIISLLFAGATANGQVNGVDIEETIKTVRFVHAAPYAGVVDVWNDKGILAKNFDYGLVSDRIKSGQDINETIYLAIAGTEKIVAELSLSELKGGYNYTIVVHNTKSMIRRGYDLSVAILEDVMIGSESSATWTGILHSAADVGKVQFQIDQPGDLSIFNPWNYLDQSDFSGFVALETPTRVMIDANFDQEADLAFSIPALPSSEMVYAFVVSDDSGVYLFALLSDNTLVKIKPDAPEADPEMSYVRIVHLAAGAGAVDIYLNGETKAVSGLDFQETVSYVALPSSDITVNLIPEGQGFDKTVYKTTLGLEPGVSYTAVAYLTKYGLELQVTEDKRSSDRITLTSKVRASHLIESVGEVDVYVIDATSDDIHNIKLIDDLRFEYPQGYLNVVPNQYRIGLDINQDTISDLTYDLPKLFPGDIVDLYAAINGEGNPSIFTVVESGEIFESLARELKGLDPIDGETTETRNKFRGGAVTYQPLPDVIIDPPGDNFQPFKIMK